MWEAFKDALSFAASLMGWKQKRQELENSDEMRANAAAATRQRIAEQAAKDVLDRADLDQLRKDAGEN